MTETANKEKAGGGLPPTTGRGNHMRAGAVNKTIQASVPPRTDGRKWESFDVWLARYEAATGDDVYHPSIPGGPRAWGR